MLKDKVLAELVDSGHVESVYEMIEPAFSLIELPDNKKLMEDHKKNFNEYNEMFKKILGSPLFDGTAEENLVEAQRTFFLTGDLLKMKKKMLVEAMDDYFKNN